MQHARPVLYPVGRSRRLEWVATTVWGIGAMAVCYWMFATSVALASAIVAGLLLFLVACLGWSASRSLVCGELRWEDESWRLDSQAGELDVIADGQGWIFFRWRSVKAVQWGLAERANGRHRWADLRRAVYSRAGSDLQGEESAKKQSR